MSVADLTVPQLGRAIQAAVEPLLQAQEDSFHEIVSQVIGQSMRRLLDELVSGAALGRCPTPKRTRESVKQGAVEAKCVFAPKASKYTTSMKALGQRLTPQAAVVPHTIRVHTEPSSEGRGRPQELCPDPVVPAAPSCLHTDAPHCGGGAGCEKDSDIDITSSTSSLHTRPPGSPKSDAGHAQGRTAHSHAVGPDSRACPAPPPGPAPERGGDADPRAQMFTREANDERTGERHPRASSPLSSGSGMSFASRSSFQALSDTVSSCGYVVINTTFTDWLMSGFEATLVGGEVVVKQASAITISRVADPSSAYIRRRVRTGDVIIDVNGKGEADLIMHELTHSPQLAMTVMHRPRGTEASAQRASSVTRVRDIHLERDSELLSDVVSESDARPSSSRSKLSSRTSTTESALERQIQYPLLLCLCGILPWEHSWMRPASSIYRWFVLLLVALIILASAEPLFQMRALHSENRAFQFQHYCNLVISASSLLGLAALRHARFSTLLRSTIVERAWQMQIVPLWSRNARRRCLVASGSWLCSMTLHNVIVWQDPGDADNLQRLLCMSAFAAASFVFTGIVFAVFHLTAALRLMLGRFCANFTESQHIEEGVRTWNALQAVVRSASKAIEAAFLVVTSAGLMLLLLGLGVTLTDGASAMWRPSSIMPLSLVALLLFYDAAYLTEQCTRVVPLINSLSCDGVLDGERLYLVQYVTHSAAGFYVCEVRLTAAMALKFTYIVCVCAFGLLAWSIFSIH